MGRYISADEVKQEIPDTIQGLLTDDTASGDTTNSDFIEQKIMAAEQEFESYVSSRYSLPVRASDDTVPGQVKQHVFVILKYYLYGRRQAIDQGLADQYSKTIRFLENVAAGKVGIALLDSEGEVEDEGSGQIYIGGTENSKFDRFI